MIKDSGERTEFDSGAVRDMHEGKGRFDLMPLDAIYDMFSEALPCEIIYNVQRFVETGDEINLVWAAREFLKSYGQPANKLLDLAKHFEQGAQKYGEYNWQKGIPLSSYVDSMLRHYTKYINGDTDERHDIAFLWNVVCAIWTCKNKPEYNSYKKEG